MAKTLSAILSGPIGLIDRKLGAQISGIGLTIAGAITGNAALIALGSFQLSQGFAPKVPKPDTTEVSQRTPRPSRVKAYGTSRLFGKSICFETIDGQTVDVWAFHDGRASAIIQPYLNDDRVLVVNGIVQKLPDKRYQSNNVRAGWSLGRPVETAFAAVTSVMPEWDANHRGDGVVCGYLLKKPEKDKYFLETYPQGDNVVLSLAGQWSPVYDPRDPTQNPYAPETWKHSENAVLAFIEYLMTERGKDWNAVFLPKLPMILEAINDAGSQRALASGGSEMKYRTALSFERTTAPAAVISSLLACFDGWYTFNEEGHLILYSGKVYTPTVEIGPDHIVAFSHQAGVADEDSLNEIGVTYVSALHDYNTVEAQSWRDEDDIAERGAIRSDDLGAVVPSYQQGRYLAKRKMARANAADRGRVSTNFSGRIVEGQRYIRLNLTEGGATFFRGVAEVMTLERDEMTGGFTFDWIAVDPNMDAWNPTTEDGEGAPVGNRYAPAPVAPPVIESIATDRGENTAYDTPGVKLTLVASGPNVDGLTWYVRTRAVGGSAWLEQAYPDLDPGPSVTLQTGFLAVGQVEVEVSYRTADGRLSDWVSPGEAINTGAVLPEAVTGLSAASDSIIVADWTAGRYATRYLVEVIVEA